MKKKYRMPRGYVRFTRGMKVDVGDKVKVDLGGVELAGGTVSDTKEMVLGKEYISFWSYSGWRHLEIAKPSQIMYIKKKK
jgi:hypothetical protein